MPPLDNSHVDKYALIHHSSKRKNLSWLPAHLGYDVHGGNIGSPAILAESQGIPHSELWILYHRGTPGHDLLQLFHRDDSFGGYSDVETSKDYDERKSVGWWVRDSYFGYMQHAGM